MADWRRLEVAYEATFPEPNHEKGSNRRAGRLAKKAVLAYLCWKVNTQGGDDDGWAWPKQETIANELHIDSETVRRCLRELQDEGWIVSKRRRGRGVQYKLFDPRLGDRAALPTHNGDRAAPPNRPGSTAHHDRAALPGVIEETGKEQEGPRDCTSEGHDPTRIGPRSVRCGACGVQLENELSAGGPR